MTVDELNGQPSISHRPGSEYTLDRDEPTRFRYMLQESERAETGGDIFLKHLFQIVEMICLMCSPILKTVRRVKTICVWKRILNQYPVTSGSPQPIWGHNALRISWKTMSVDG